METLLILAHVEENGSLGRPALEALAAAEALGQALGAKPVVGLVGADPGAAAESIGSYGAARWLAAAGPEFAQPRYATDAQAAGALAKAAGATVVLAPATSRWSRSLAGAAQRAGGRADTHITALNVENGKLLATRWFYRQRIEATLTRAARPWFLTLEPGCWTPWSGAAAPVVLETVAVEAASRTQVLGKKAPQAGEQTIRPDAELLFVAGAGWTKKQPDGRVRLEEAAELILSFVRLTQCSLGSSKSLVDLSSEGETVLPFLTHMNQVGQTGSTPRHPKGLATCCHGEEPHTVGWRFIQQRRAVNLDPNCGWARGKADVLYVADAFEVMAKVNQLLSK